MLNETILSNAAHPKWNQLYQLSRIFLELASWKLGGVSSFVAYSAEFNTTIHRCRFPEHFSPGIFSPYRSIGFSAFFILQAMPLGHMIFPLFVFRLKNKKILLDWRSKPQSVNFCQKLWFFGQKLVFGQKPQILEKPQISSNSLIYAWIQKFRIGYQCIWIDSFQDHLNLWLWIV